jgi:hypothetical protein
MNRVSPRRRALAASIGAALLSAALGACGGHHGSAYTVAPSAARDIPAPRASARSTGARLLDWSEFGLDPARSSATDRSTGITVANLPGLARLRVSLPGTVDSSPVYLHGAMVAGVRHDVTIVTTSYGRTVAVDVHSGQILWLFSPPGYARWAGSSQITNTSPLVDPDRSTVYVAAPDGRIYRLAVDSGTPAGGGWPVTLTRDPGHEKLAAALNMDGRYLVAATGGYFGDAPPYQGHVALIDRATGRLVAVWNSLCADRRVVIVPSSCSSSDSAIWARGGAVVEPDGRLLVATGNGPYNASTDFGDSVVELDVPSLNLRQAYTPRDQHQLDASDNDLGSSAPALLGSGRIVQGGKDGVLRVLDTGALDGASGVGRVVGGELQRLPTPAGAELFTAPAVWSHAGHTTLFVADAGATAAYTLQGGRLRSEWSNSYAGTSPVMAGGLLYVYDPGGGGVRVYSPGSARPVATLPCAAGHWNSPIVVDGHVIVPTGNANDHSQHGTLTIFSA